MLFKNLDVALRWLTSVIGFLVAFSIVRLLLYYKAFNIQITTYLSFTECVLLFTDQLALYCWFAIIIGIVYTTLYFMLSVVIKNFRYADLINLVYHHKKWVRILMVILFVLPLIYLVNALLDYNYHHARKSSFIAAAVFSLGVLLYAVVFFFRMAKTNVQTKQASNLLTVYIIGICTVCFYTSMLRRQLYLVEVNGLNQQVACFDANDKKIIESNFSNNIQYLGSTKECIIFYDMGKKTASVYYTAAFARIDFGPTNYQQVPGWSIYDVLY